MNKDKMSMNKDTMSMDKDKMSMNKDKMSMNKDKMFMNKDKMFMNKDTMFMNKTLDNQYRVDSCSMILLGDPGACLRLNHHSSLTRVRATCSPVSGGKTIRLCSCWPSGGPPTPLRSSVTAERFGPRSDFDSRSDDGGFVLVGTLSRDLLASNNQSL